MAQRRNKEHSQQPGAAHEPIQSSGYGSRFRSGALLGHLKRTFWDHKFHWIVVAAIIYFLLLWPLVRLISKLDRRQMAMR